MEKQVGMNYNMRDKLRHESGVLNFLAKKGLIDTGKRGVINKVLVEFLSEYSLPIEQYNPKYKGNYDALNQNCTTAQENWDKFCLWVNKQIKEKV
jgi:hypothetical protein